MHLKRYLKSMDIFKRFLHIVGFAIYSVSEIICAATTNTSNLHYISAGGGSNDNWDSYSLYQKHLCTEDSSTQSALSSPSQGYDIVVSCCLTDGSDGIRPDCDTQGSTYEEAVAICEQHGYRLCTLQEILYDELVLGKGCSYDGGYNWVSDTCVPTR